MFIYCLQLGVSLAEVQEGLLLYKEYIKQPRLITIWNPNTLFRQTIWKPNHPKSEHQNVRNWDGVRFSSPTVYGRNWYSRQICWFTWTFEKINLSAQWTFEIINRSTQSTILLGFDEQTANQEIWLSELNPKPERGRDSTSFQWKVFFKVKASSGLYW